MKRFVKSFSAGLASGIDGAIDRLDQCVSQMGNIIVHSVKDTYYTKEQNTINGTCPGPRLVRVVIYSKIPGSATETNSIPDRLDEAEIHTARKTAEFDKIT